MTTSSKVRKAALAAGYRSGFEDRTSRHLVDSGLAAVAAAYETVKINYTKPASVHKYTPDFPVNKFVFIETKGRFMPADRQKHMLIKRQSPQLDIRFVFERAATPINKGSKTTYADWCDKNGFKWADKHIPQSWIEEFKKDNHP
jgi:hypothetical protein